MSTTAEEMLESDAPGQTLEDRVNVIIGRLEAEALDRVNKKGPIEQRWLEDLRQFHGEYEDKILADLEESKKSTVFINQTRPKTNAMEARLSDMLFPTDENNWGIKPTPVPELAVQAETTARAAADTAAQAAQDPNNQAWAAAAAKATQEFALLKQQQQEARRAALAMEEEIEDHLREGDYSSQAREVIRDGCKLGTGVFKGPVTGAKMRRSWKKRDGNVYEMTAQSDERPSFWRVDPWNYFPDMDVTTPNDGEGDLERHLLNKKQLRKLAKQPGFDVKAIRTLLETTPRASVPTYLNDLRSITGGYAHLIGDRYHVWEYHGPISGKEMETLVQLPGNEAYADDLPKKTPTAEGEDGEVDPLAEINVVIWFCQGVLLKLGIHHLDSGDSIYSVFCLEKDESSIFGFGVPYLMRDSQKSLAAAWRALLDNMGLSSGPQVVINDSIIEPVDGIWTLVARKLWRRKESAAPDKKPFETFDIPSHMADLLAIIEVSKKNIDEETSLPLIAQGDQSSQITKTAGGMSMLMNSVNVVFRRIVKNWDDDITDPVITRMYDWLMQFSRKESIKGDYEVDARGTSVLLVREMQSANLMAFLVHFGAHPILAKYLKKEGLPALRRLAQVLMIPADEVIKTDNEVLEDEAKAAAAKKEPSPEMQKILAELEAVRMKNDATLQLAAINRETEMLKLAGQMNVSVDKINADLIKVRETLASKERTFAAEAAIEASKPDPKPGEEGKGGSGGYFSK